MEESLQKHSFECAICFCGFEADGDARAIPLSTCIHVYHQECLTDFFKAQINEKRVDILCPDPTCESPISDREIKEVLKADENFDKWLKFRLSIAIDQNPDILWCPTPDCTLAFSIDPGVTQLKCTHCCKEYCIPCKSLTHQGQTCEEYTISRDPDKAEQAVLEFVKKSNFK